MRFRLLFMDLWELFEVMILGDESLDAVDEDCLWSQEPIESPFTVSAYTACEMIKINREKFISIASQEEEAERIRVRLGLLGI